MGGHEGELFTDNGRALYKYLSEAQDRYKVFWVINRNSPERGGVPAPILRGSVKNYLVFLAAEGVFYSHTGSDIAPVLHNFVKNKRTVRMFIEHGIVGLKKAKLAIDSRSTHLGPEADLWVCSSAFEQAIKTEDWGLPRDRGPITGLARYDALLPKDSYQRQVLLIPTWREWLMDCSDGEFVASEFYQSLRSLLGNSATPSSLRD